MIENKFYTRSNGDKVLLTEMNYEHLSNALAKKLREVFNAIDDEDYNNKINEINDIKEEMYRRINDFHEEQWGKNNE